MFLFLLALLPLIRALPLYCQAQICLPCYYRCQSCTGPAPHQCVSCLQDYVYSQSSCEPCTPNCLSCVSGGATGRCQTCQSQFYLSQSSGSCKRCPEGALACTFAAVQQCLPGYYLQNSLCLFCLPNCIQCSNAYSCVSCKNGFHLTAQNSCVPCQLTGCSTCNDDNSCGLCADGYYGTTCQLYCPTFCSVCDSSTCYQCSSGYFMSGSGSCQAGPVLCQLADAVDSCIECLTDRAYLVQGSCVPYYSVHLTNKQLYLRSNNDIALFTPSNFVNCALFTLVYSESGTLQVSIIIEPSFGLLLKVQIATQHKNITPILEISSGLLVQTHSFNLTSQYTYNCNGRSLVLGNFQMTFTPKIVSSLKSNTLSISFNVNNGGFIGISEMLVQQILCLISGCSTCMSTYSCNLCLSPLYLQENACLSQCTTGYYLTPALSICTLTCPSGFYPLLADYLCQSCISPCSSCSSQTECMSCLQGWFLLGNSCLNDCPVGYFKEITSSSCQPCRYPCKSCADSNSNCNSCNLGYLQPLNGSCAMECPAGFFPNFSLIACSSCSAPCSTCQFSSSKCSSCLSSFFLNPNGSCLASCQFGYFSNTVSRLCEKCLFPCRSCDKTISQCESCFAGYLYDSKCLEICPQGYYADMSSKLCSKCSAPCLTCVSPTQCSSCTASTFYLASASSCLSNCPNTTYAQKDTCNPCLPPCLTCLSATNCTSCVGYLLVNYKGSCLLACPSSTFLFWNDQSQLKTCLSCSTNCSSCLSTSICLKCNQTYLWNGVCGPSCPELTYPIDNTCLNCSFPCHSCWGSDLCLSCESGYYLYSPLSSCLQVCPAGTYAFNRTCFNCSSMCQLCKDAVSCLSCSQGFYQLPNGTCSSSCISGMYPYSPLRICKQCSSLCLQCMQGNLCLSCKPNSTHPWMYGYSCLSECPLGYVPQSEKCVQCTFPCLTCSFRTSNCTSCSSSYLLQVNLTENSCLQSCRIGFFANSGGICIACQSPCSSCLSQTYCLACLKGNQLLHNGRCLFSCPSHYFSFNSTCQLCTLPCLQCVSSSDNCTYCPPDRYLQAVSNKFSCLSSCTAGFYQNSVSLICTACEFPCKTCRATSKCINCQTGYLLQFQICLAECFDGYFASNGVCMKCFSPCSSCLSNETCLSCLKGFFYDQNTGLCMQACSSGMYAFQTSNGQMQCLGCPSNCLQCYDYSACKSCSSNSSRPYLQGTNCQAGCTDGYYVGNNSLICQWCGWGCLSCQNPTACLRCSDSYLLDGVCQVQCPITYYQSLAFTCERCLSPCFQCYDSANCQYCQAGYYLYLTHCLQACPQQMWTVPSMGLCNQTCIPPFFQIPSSRLCVNSCDIYYDQQARCRSQCSSDMMANQSLGCQSCSTADCSLRLYFQLSQQQINGHLQLLFIFNFPLDNPSAFTSDSIQLQFIFSANSLWKEKQISALRQLQEVSNADLQVVSASAQLIIVEVSMGAYEDCFSGKVQVIVNDLRMATYQGYPLQSPSAELNIDWFQSSTSADAATYIGYIISGYSLALLMINFFFDNSRAVLPLIEGLQTLQALLYLQIWYPPWLQNFLLALRFVAFRQSVGSFGQPVLWDCPSKYLLVFGSCDMLSQLFFPVIVLALLILVAIGCRFIKIFEGKHRFLWTHFYSLFWIAAMPIGLTAFRVLSADMDGQILAGGLLAVMFLCWGGILSYLIVREVYSGGYSQKCFFWGLQQKHSVQPLANLHPLLTIMRRITLVVGIGVAGQRPLSCLFIVTLLSLYILSNILFNRAYRLHPIIMGTIQLLLTLLLVLLQMYIVNAAKISNDSWNIFGYALIFIVIIYSVFLCAIATYQTVRCLRKYYKLATLKAEEKADKDSEESSQKATDKQSNKESSAPPSQPQNAQSDDTQHQLLRANSDMLSPSGRAESSVFSDNFSQVGPKTAGKRLIKVQKEKFQRQQQ